MKIHGSATLRLNGQHIETNDDATLTVGGTKNTPRTIGKKFYHSESYMASKVECKVPVTAETSLRELQEMSGVELHFLSDTGRTYIIREAVQTAEVSVQGGESGGEASLVFEGEAAEEVL